MLMINVVKLRLDEVWKNVLNVKLMFNQKKNYVLSVMIEKSIMRRLGRKIEMKIND